MAVANQELSTKKDGTLNKLPLLLGIAGILFLSGWLVSQVIPVWRATSSLLDSRAQAESLMADGLTNIDPEDAESLVYSLNRDVDILNRHLGPILPLAAKLYWLPKIGPLLSIGPELMSMADTGTDSAYYAMKGLKPALAILQDRELAGNEKIPLLLGVIDEAESELIKTSLTFDRVVESRNKIENIDELPYRIRTLIERFDQELPLALAGLKMAIVLPSLMGFDEPVNYLLIAQNEDELRPTGGFISGAGFLTIDRGAISSLIFEDANIVDDWENKPYELPPEPLQKYMLSELFLFRDANFWPDFPTSAEKAMDLYSYSREVPLDGAVAIDQSFIRFLLQAVGPIYSPELDLQVNASNVVDELRAQWEPDENDDRNWTRSRKDFMGPLASTLMTKLMSDFDSFDSLYLARILVSAADQSHLQIYVQDRDAAAVLGDLGWNGQQDFEAASDYLHVIDTNVGFNKVNSVVEREINYQVNLSELGSPEAALTITYSHKGQSGVSECRQASIDYNPSTITYSALVNDCYWNYLRVYVPGGSWLTSASSHAIDGELLLSKESSDGVFITTTEINNPFTTFENLLKIIPGEKFTTTLDYVLPPGILETTKNGFKYSLLVQKQAGTMANPLRVKVLVPPGSILQSSLPEPDDIKGDALFFDTSLIADQKIELIFSHSLEG